MKDNTRSMVGSEMGHLYDSGKQVALPHAILVGQLGIGLSRTEVGWLTLET